MRWFLCICVAMGLLAVNPPLQAKSKLTIDHIDTSKYEEKGLLRFYVDIHDGEGRTIPDQSKSGLSFYVNEEKIAKEQIERIKIKQFSDLDEPVALGILFTNYSQFLPLEPSEKAPFGLAVNGLRQLIDSLREGFDSVGIWLYNEEGLKTKLAFKNNLEEASETLTKLEDRMNELREDAEEFNKRTSKPEPKFYKLYLKMLKEMAKETDLPRRRILIVISDGRSVRENERSIKKNVDKIIAKSLKKGIKIYAFGVTLDDDSQIQHFFKTAEATYGRSFAIDAREPDELTNQLEGLQEVLFSQYVVDVTVPDLPSKDKVAFKIRAKTSDGSKVTGVYKKIQLPATPIAWWYIIKWYILFPLILLFSFFVLVWLVKKIIAWRRGRSQDVVYEEQEEYAGPDRGKLQIFSGPLAGEVFHLTEDVTTIGSIDGNSVVIPDEGVSKRHAGIKIEEMRYELADFGSTNGTLVNGRKINRQFLADGDTIRIGNSEMTFLLK